MIDTNKFKELLESEKKDLVEQLSHVGRINPEDPNDWIPAPSDDREDHADQSDRADQMEELGEHIAEERLLEGRLKDVLAALKRIDDGNYGKCNEGGEEHDIEEARLEANPAANTCVAHAS